MSDGGLRGADLARLFHTEVVGPWLARELPGLRYAAGRLGSGSDVLGLDDGTSRDHDWGCRLRCSSMSPTPAWRRGSASG